MLFLYLNLFRKKRLEQRFKDNHILFSSLEKEYTKQSGLCVFISQVIVPLGFLPVEIWVAFPGENQL